MIKILQLPHGNLSIKNLYACINNAVRNSQFSDDATETEQIDPGIFAYLSQNLDILNNSWHVDIETPIIPNPSKWGGLIVIVKKIVKKLTRWKDVQIWQQQNNVNVTLVNTINDFAWIIKELCIRQGQLEYQILALKAERDNQKQGNTPA